MDTIKDGSFGPAATTAAAAAEAAAAADDAATPTPPPPRGTWKCFQRKSAVFEVFDCFEPFWDVLGRFEPF